MLNHLGINKTLLLSNHHDHFGSFLQQPTKVHHKLPSNILIFFKVFQINLQIFNKELKVETIVLRANKERGANFAITGL